MLEEAGELPLLKELPSIVLRGKCIHPNIASPYIYHSTKNGDLDPYVGTNQVLNLTGFHVRRNPKIWKQDLNLNAIDENLFINKWEDDPILMGLESSSSNLILRKYCKAFQTFHGNASNKALAAESIRYDQMKEKKKKKKRPLNLATKQSVGLCSSNSISQMSAFLHDNDNGNDNESNDDDLNGVCSAGITAMACSNHVPPPFLTKTYQLVDDPTTDHIVSWGEYHNQVHHDDNDDEAFHFFLHKLFLE